MDNLKVVEREAVPQKNDNPDKISRVSPLVDHMPNKIDPLCVSITSPRSYESGRYQQLRATLERGKPGLRGVVAVTSPAAGDGKTLTAINLAGAFAQNSDSKILLVDVDLRRTSESLRQYLDIRGNTGSGLTDILYQTDCVKDPVLHIRELPNLSILPRGILNTNPYELLASSRFGEFIQQVRSRYNYVILDAPPIMPVPDNAALADWVDGFVMVVSANVTPKDVLAESLRILGQEKLIGMVLNQCDPLAKKYYNYYGVYGKRQGNSD